MFIFLLGSYRVPIVTATIGERPWRGRSDHEAFDIMITGQVPAVRVIDIRPAENDNAAGE